MTAVQKDFLKILLMQFIAIKKNAEGPFELPWNSMQNHKPLSQKIEVVHVSELLYLSVIIQSKLTSTQVLSLDKCI